MPQRCTECGHIYIPGEHDGTSLIDLANWECPGNGAFCGATADKYELIEPGSPLEDVDEVEERASFTTSAAHTRKLTAERADKAVTDLARMVDDGDLVLRPDWQGYYAWSNKQASQLIESLLLQLPIPLIYLAEEEDGSFSVVDGQQRLTALYEFVRNKRIDPLKSAPVTLSGLDVFDELNGRLFSELDPAQQKFLKNRELQIIRIKSESDPDVKLEVFRRLNTGSVKLNAQELRNAAFRGPYNDELKKWARNPTFLKMLRADAKPDIRMLDVEMMLRGSSWINRRWQTLTSKNIGHFLDEEMVIGRTYSAKKLSTLEAEAQERHRPKLANFRPACVSSVYYRRERRTGWSVGVAPGEQGPR